MPASSIAMESVSKHERLASLTAAIECIIDQKKALLRSPAASAHVAALACLRWQLTKAFCNYRWFIRSALGVSAGDGACAGPALRTVAAVDEVHALLRDYVTRWSSGDNVVRWADYQAAASRTLEEIAAAVRRISAESEDMLRAGRTPTRSG